MKSLVQFFVLAMATLSVSGYAMAEMPKEKEIMVSVNEAFIPGGFDSNSEAYAVVSGLFPNGCYRWSHSTVTHDNDENFHEVRSIAKVSEGLCIMVLVPYTKEVRLGKLSSGEHRIRFVNGDGTYMEKKLVIE